MRTTKTSSTKTMVDCLGKLRRELGSTRTERLAASSPIPIGCSESNDRPEMTRCNTSSLPSLTKKCRRPPNRLFQHLITTYASETNKTASMWRAVPDDYLGFQAARENQHDQDDHGPPDPLGAKVLRPVRRHPGTTSRGVAASGRQISPFKPTSTSTSGWQSCDCRNWPQRPNSGG